ncbi:CocE/NonD family hydrolase [Emticicia sp. 21SJ11W-3]|uniref:CocE/NonD family hydrolase n=1 Tax=Emticicia sp. 21SJ11W-3 TaxID=2916755 RepID=UPI00209F0976|nr:CocE/NonD family hydrolase [Emticicia sp. 21SJ11W-3]UTA66790.1 CocE/NonD family hydrolase [Emticicia sp. 21SJ11W-3]
MRSFILVLMFFCTVAVSAQTPDPSYVQNNYLKREVYITMRDGVRLFTSIYLPKDSTKKYPVMMQRTPYSVAPYGEGKLKTQVGPSAELMQDGFIFVYQDVRGRWMSEGEFIEMRPHQDTKSGKAFDESTDTYDTIEWLMKNLNYHNGKVGMWGISYPGFYASAGLMANHPALVASSPQAPMADLWRGDDSYHNGAFMLPHNFGFYPSFTNRTDGKPTQTPGKRFDFGTPDGYQFYLNLGPIKNSLKYAETLGKDPYWRANLEHPNYDEFWKSRNILNHHNGIRHAVMVVGGWYDAEDLYGTFKTYQSVEQKNPGIVNIFVIGPWVHGGWARGDGDILGNVNFGQKTGIYYRQNIERKFFNYYLKGIGDNNFNEATMYETGSNQWRTFTEWPPKAAKERNLYFGANGKLSFDAPAAAQSASQYTSDPAKPVPSSDYITSGMPREYMVDDQRHASRRPDVLTFQTDVLDKDITLAGNIWADLKVSTTGTDADFVVKVIDVYPDDAKDNPNTAKHIRMAGYQQMVRSEAMRGKFRKSFDTPVPFKPGKVEEINFELQDVLHTFKKGHRIMVQVQSTFFPIIDRNPQKFLPNIHYADASDFQSATHKVYHDKTNASHLKVRVLE